MCGIVGIIDRKGRAIDQQLIASMTHAIAHRGPDGSGIYVKENVAIGHRRLSIIDPALGKQPMFNEDGTVAITFNGEIYNYLELRALLQAAGHLFKTQSDTEVVVHAYEEWGTHCVERFRGMFAFGIVDSKRRELFLARDHFGIKPLVYAQTREWFGFASELQGLYANKSIPLSIDMGAIDQYLWLQYIPAPKTAFCDFYKLLPAHRMTVSFDGEIREHEEYWRLEFSPIRERSFQDTVDAVDAALEESVRAHMMSDVPFGCFLSGGVDSSLVLAYMTKILNKPVDAFTIDFEDAEFSELEYAKRAAAQCGANHHVDVVRVDALSILPELVKHYGEPFGDSSAVPTYYVSKLARAKVPMVLSGDAADEMFAGYWSYRDFLERNADIVDILRGVIEGGNNSHDFRIDSGKSFDSLEQWTMFINYLPLSSRSKLWRPEFQNCCPTPSETFLKAFERSQSLSLLHKIQYMDTQTYLPYDILTKVDVASMMHGLEVRTPILDRKIVDLARQIPERYSLDINGEGDLESKIVLKAVALRYYPADLIRRPKKGFAMPVASWFAAGTATQKTVFELLLRPDSCVGEWFEPQMILNLFNEQKSGPIWLLLFLEVWLLSISGSPQPVAGSVEVMSPT